MQAYSWTKHLRTRMLWRCWVSAAFGRTDHKRAGEVLGRHGFFSGKLAAVRACISRRLGAGISSPHADPSAKRLRRPRQLDTDAQVEWETVAERERSALRGLAADHRTLPRHPARLRRTRVLPRHRDRRVLLRPRPGAVPTHPQLLPHGTHPHAARCLLHVVRRWVSVLRHTHRRHRRLLSRGLRRQVGWRVAHYHLTSYTACTIKNVCHVFKLHAKQNCWSYLT